MPRSLPKPGWQHLDPGHFRAVAAFLHRVAPEGGRRVHTRQDQLKEASSVATALPDHWVAAEAEAGARALAKEMAEALQNIVSAVKLGDVLPASADGFSGLVEVGDKAHRVAAVLDEVNPLVQEWNQQAVSFGSETFDRATTFVFQNERSDELERYYHEQWRRVEDATARHDQALREWRDLCGNVADVLRRATDKLDGLVLECPDQLRPPSAHHPEAMKQYVRRRWAERAVEPFIGRNLGNPGALEDWWSKLEEGEKKALIETRPDLVDNYLRPYLNEADLKQLDKANKHAVRVVQYQFDLKFYVPVGGHLGEPSTAMVEMTTAATVRKTVNSDGSVDVRFDAKLGAGMAGFAANTKSNAGGEGKYSLTLRFATAGEYDAARAKLDKAQEQDSWLAYLWSGSDTRKAIDDLFGKSVGYEVSGGAAAAFETKFGPNAGKLSGSLAAGYYDDNVRGEHGLYLQGKASVSNEKTWGRIAAGGGGEATIVGRLAWTDDGRRFARLRITAEASESATATLTSLSLSPDAVAKLKAKHSFTEGVNVAVKIEVTDENYDRVTGLVGELAAGRISLDRFQALSTDLDVTLLITGGITDKGSVTPGASSSVTTLPDLPPPPGAGRPVSPLGDLGITRKDTHTVAAYKKPPGGELYRLDD